MPELMDSVYVAPEAFPGDPVLFYQDADKGQYPSVGFVVRCDGRAVDIITLQRQGPRYHQEVHHMSDPLIKNNANIKSYGGWEVNQKFNAAANIFEVTQALQRRLDKVYEKLGLRDTEARVEEMIQPEVPVVAEAAADVGLSNVVFAQPSGPEIEGGVVKSEEITVESILKHISPVPGTPFNKDILARKMGEDVAKVAALLTPENGFNKVQFGHFTYHPKNGN